MKVSRRLRLPAVLSSLVLAGLLLGAGSASAAVRYPFLGQVTGAGTPAGALASPDGVAVDGATGDLLVSDNGAGTQYVGIFSPSGAFQGIASCASTPNGSSCRPQGVAADAQTGQIFMADAPSGSGVPGVEVFDSSGAFESEITGAGVPGGFGRPGTGAIAVDQATGDLYVYDSTHEAVDEFDSSGNFVSQISSAGGTAFSNVTGLAFDGATGDLLVADAGAESVYAFDSTGALVSTLTGAGTPQGAFSGNLLFVAANDSTGDVYVAVFGGNVVDQFDSTGAFINQIPGPPQAAFARPGGVAVDQASGDVAVLNGVPAAVDIFGPDAVTFPDVTTQAVSSVQPGSATLNGTVNPDGMALTGCHFEYGPTTAYGQTVACIPAAGSIAPDSADHQVSANVTGLTPGTVFHYRLVATNANGDTDGQDLVVGPPQALSVAATPAKTTAALTAQINPDGVDTTCEFEYVSEAGYDPSASDPYSAGHTVPCSADLGDSSIAVSGSASISGLETGMVYHYRVVTTNAAGTVDGPDRKFTTTPAAQFGEFEISNVTGTSATVTGQINPVGDDTHYHFEWGTTTSYGNDTPVPDADIGAGSSDVTVTAQLTGLSANTVYHVRVVATNAAGTADSGDHTFSAVASGAALPDGRVYEQVTPVDKNGAQFDAGLFLPNPMIAGDGDQVIAASIQCLPGAQACTANRQTEGELFSLTRTADGWTQTALAPPATEFPESTAWTYDVDANSAVFTGEQTPGAKDVLIGRLSDGSLRVFGPVVSQASSVSTPGDAQFMATGDLSEVAFADDSRTLDWPFDSTLPSAAASSTFEYSGAGGAEPTLVGVTGGAGSTSLVSQCGTLLDWLSQDGQTVVFDAPGHDVFGCPATATAPATREVLARIGGDRTVLLSGRSAAGCTTSACQSSAAQDATFQAASDDGSKILFSSNQQLTDDATQGSTNLYEYDFGNPAGHELIDISAGDTSGSGPGVQGLVAQSADGSHAYFVAGGVLTVAPNDQGQTPTAGADNLYVYQRDAQHPAGSLAFVTTLPAADQADWAGSKQINVTPDGRFLVFPSHGDLTADDSSVSGAQQIFRYDAQDAQLIRISIGQDGFDDNGNAGDPSLCDQAQVTLGSCTADATLAQYPLSPRSTQRRDPTMSDDGQFVFFNSPAGLTPKAFNFVQNQAASNLAGEPVYVQNVYEYHDGHVFLISDGKDTYARRGLTPLLGTDATGANVFFKTFDSLVPQDTDGGQLDIYDARIGGGFPDIQPAAPCGGDTVSGCQGAPAAPPPPPVAATVAFTGPGDAVPAKAVKAATVTKPKLLTTTVRGDEFTMKVKVPGKGRITVAGVGAQTVHKAVSKAGTYQLRVSLTPKDRRMLVKRKTLRLMLSVSFNPTGGSARVTRVPVTVKPAITKSTRRARRARQAAGRHHGGAK